MSKWNPDPDQGAMMLRGGTYIPPIFGETKWRPPKWDQLPPMSAWASAKRAGFDYETKDQELRELGPGCRRPGNHTVGYSFSLWDEREPVSQWPRFYVPYAHGTDMDENSRIDNVDYDAKAYLKDAMKAFHGDLVGANLAYDIDWGMTDGIDFSSVHRFCDVLIADPLLYELHDEYSLEAVGIRRIGLGKDEAHLRKAAREYGVDPKSQMWSMPGRMIGPYAEIDAVRPLQIYEVQLQAIESEGIEKCWDMECRLLPLLIKMTRKGVRVNEQRLADIDTWCVRQETQALVDIAEWTAKEGKERVVIPQGESYNVELMTKALRSAGLDDLIGKTASGKDSVKKESLQSEIDHPVAKAMARAHQVATVRTTFVTGVKRHLINGRIHASFNQIRKTDDTTGDSSGVAYGRLSMSHVNMQNQPGNSRFTGDNEMGPLWRSIYEAEPGEQWASKDLKQQEPKWSFHYGAMLEEAAQGLHGIPRGELSKTERLMVDVKGALALCAALQANPMLDTYEPIVDLAGVPRSKAKVIWLARAYGKGDAGLCKDLGLPTQQGVFSKDGYKWVPVNSPEGERAIAACRRRGEEPRAKEIAGPEGQALIDKFDDGMSFLKISARLASDRGNERGYVTLLDGRRCHFKPNDPNNPRPGNWDDKGSGYDWTHKAFNRIIQGTAAWQTKAIMLGIDDAGYGDRLMLQVHDEVASSMPFGDEGVRMAHAVADVMKTVVPMRVPTVVDIEMGPSWGESMFVEYNDKAGKKQKVQYEWGLTIADGEVVRRGTILGDDTKSSTIYIPKDHPRLNTNSNPLL